MKQQKSLSEIIKEYVELQVKIRSYYWDKTQEEKISVIHFRDNKGIDRYVEINEIGMYGAKIYNLEEVAEILMILDPDLQTVIFQLIVDDLKTGLSKNTRARKSFKSLLKLIEY